MSYDPEFDYDSVLRTLRSFGEMNLDYFSERLRLQKLGYLIQELGINEGYRYSWYVHGPYSSVLTYLFAGDEIGVFNDEVELDKNEIKISKLLKELLGVKVNNPKTLELFASIWYLMPKHKITEDDKTNILRVMCKEKPHFQSAQIKDALNKILRFRKKHSL